MYTAVGVLIIIIAILLILIVGLLFASCGTEETVEVVEKTPQITEKEEVEEKTPKISETTGEAAGNVVEVEIDAFSFGYSLEEIKVKVGDTVKLTLTNSGGSHDWVVDEIEGAKTAVIKGGDTTTIEFTATESGSFSYYCSVGSHRAAGMEGTLIVE